MSDLEAANARVRDLTDRLVTASTELAEARRQLAQLRATHEALRDTHEALRATHEDMQRSAAYRLASRIWALRNAVIRRLPR